jgi:hypothetical protein
MKGTAVSLVFFLLVSTATAANVILGMKYEGGTLPLSVHNKVKIELAPDSINVGQGKQVFDIPIKNITEVNYGQEVHRRVGEAIALGVATAGIGAIAAAFKTKKHYVGVVWTDNVAANGETPKKGGVVFKVGKGDYRGLVAALEGATGLKAVNADIGGPGGLAPK